MDYGNNKFRLIEIEQARNKIIVNGYADLSSEEWHELSLLSFQKRQLSGPYKKYENKFKLFSK